MYQNIKIGTLEQAVKYVQSLLLKLWTYLILYSTVSIVNFLQPIAGWKNKPKLDNNKNRELSKTCSKYHQQLKQTKKRAPLLSSFKSLNPWDLSIALVLIMLTYRMHFLKKKLWFLNLLMKTGVDVQRWTESKRNYFEKFCSSYEKAAALNWLQLGLAPGDFHKHLAQHYLVHQHGSSCWVFKMLAPFKV